MYVLIYTVLNGWVDGLMMNAFRMTQKENRQWKNKLWYCFKNLPKKTNGRRDRVGRKRDVHYNPNSS